MTSTIVAVIYFAIYLIVIYRLAGVNTAIRKILSGKGPARPEVKPEPVKPDAAREAVSKDGVASKDKKGCGCDETCGL